MSLFSNHHLPDQMGPAADAFGDLAHPEEEPAGPHFGYEPTEEDWRDYERWTLAGEPRRDLAVAHVAGQLQGLARLRPDLPAEVRGQLEALAAELLGAP